MASVLSELYVLRNKITDRPLILIVVWSIGLSHYSVSLDYISMDWHPSPLPPFLAQQKEAFATAAWTRSRLPARVGGGPGRRALRLRARGDRAAPGPKMVAPLQAAGAVGRPLQAGAMPADVGPGQDVRGSRVPNPGPVSG